MPSPCLPPPMSWRRRSLRIIRLQSTFEVSPYSSSWDALLTCKDAGEIGELMPGTSFELQTEFDPFINTIPTDEDNLEALAEWRPRLLIELLDVCTVFVYCQVPLIVSISRFYMQSSNSYNPPCRPTHLWSGSSTTSSHPRYYLLRYRHLITAP